MKLVAIRKVLRDLYTGPDGETIALGRVYSLPVLLVGLYAPLRVIHHQEPIPLDAIAFELGGLAAAVGGMIAVTNHIDNPNGTSLLAGLTPKGPAA